MRRGGLADRRFHQSHFRGRSTARNLRAVDNGEYVDKMWIGEDEGSRTPGDTVERLLHLARELIALRCDVIFATRVTGLFDALLTLHDGCWPRETFNDRYKVGVPGPADSVILPARGARKPP